jgi:hypothetical protein
MNTINVCKYLYMYLYLQETSKTNPRAAERVTEW